MSLPLIGSLAGLFKTKATSIDGAVFRLHYRWAASYFFLACVLTTATEYIGNPIYCITGSQVAAKAITTYCWITGTTTINSYNNESTHYTSRDTDFSGIDAYDPNKHNIRYHAYYQWVPFFLFFQGCLFYLPHLVWKTIEGKTADNLLQGLQHNSMDDDREKKRGNIVKYLKASRGHNVHYAVAYMLCEGLNFLNVIIQIFLVDKFVGGAFLRYGIKAINPATSTDALIMAFPRITSCSFYYYGYTGEKTDEVFQCVLQQNILNEKVFVVMWFLLILLATISAMELIWRVVVVLSPLVRGQLMERRGKMTLDPKLENVIRLMPLGDFCLLYVVGMNLDAGNFKGVLLSYADCSDNSVHPNKECNNGAQPNGGATYRPYSHLDEVDCDGIREARV